MAHGHGHSHHHQQQHDEHDVESMAEVLDLDAEVLGDYLAGLVAWIAERAGDTPVRRIVDLGAGTGTGTFALLRQFPDAQVTALDVSGTMLDRLHRKGGELGLAARIHPVRADLDAAWPAVGPADLVWASNSLHHMADPVRTLGEALTALRPGGLLAVAEMETFPRFLPGESGELEARAHDAVRAHHAEEMPQLGADFAPILAKAGFAVEAERRFPLELTGTLPEATGRYARASLARLRGGAEGRLGPDDLAALDALLDDDGPASVLRRDDLSVRAARTAWIARRPG